MDAIVVGHRCFEGSAGRACRAGWGGILGEPMTRPVLEKLAGRLAEFCAGRCGAWRRPAASRRWPRRRLRRLVCRWWWSIRPRCVRSPMRSANAPRPIPIDAAVIARFAVASGVKARPLADEQTRLFADLVARRRQITAMIVAEEARLKRATNRQLRKSIGRLLTALRRELKSLDADLDGHVRASPAWRIKENLLSSVPGVGQGHFAHSDRRTARARQPRSAPDRLARRPCSLHPTVRQMARQELHRRRPGQRTRRPLHGRSRRLPAQSRAQGLPRQARRQASQRSSPSSPPPAKLLTILNAIIRDQKPWQTA